MRALKESWLRNESLSASRNPPEAKAVQYLEQIRVISTRNSLLEVMLQETDEEEARRREWLAVTTADEQVRAESSKKGRGKEKEVPESE